MGKPRYVQHRRSRRATWNAHVHQARDVAVRRQLRRHERELPLREQRHGVRSDLYGEPIAEEGVATNNNGYCCRGLQNANPGKQCNLGAWALCVSPTTASGISSQETVQTTTGGY